MRSRKYITKPEHTSVDHGLGYREFVSLVTEVRKGCVAAAVLTSLGCLTSTCVHLCFPSLLARRMLVKMLARPHPRLA